MKLGTPSNKSFRDAADTRMALVLRLEWGLLAVRYCLYVGLAAASAIAAEPDVLRTLVLVGASALAHNVFTHWVLYSRRHHFFVSPLNFLLYLARFCMLVYVTGGATSPFGPAALFLIIGYHIYAPRGLNTVWVTLVVGACYSFTLMADWLFFGVDWFDMSVYVNMACIAFCGYIMHSMARLLYAFEYDARNQSMALESSEATLRAILNHTAHPILVYGENELVTEANDSACNFLGLPRERILGVRFQAFVFDDGSLLDNLDQLRETGSLHQEMLVVPSSGAERSVYMHIHSFLRENKRFFVALFHDITDIKEFQETQRLAKDKLKEANRELQRVVELRAAFYANVANRLRTPLSALLGFTDMMLEEQLGEVTEEQRNALHSARRSLLRIFSQLDEAFSSESDTRNSLEEGPRPGE